MTPVAAAPLVCAHVITSLEVGGAQRMLVKLLTSIDLERFPTRVYSLIDDGPLREPLLAAGVAVQGLGMRSGRLDGAGLVRLRRAFQRERPELVQTWLYHADLLGTVAARWAGVPRLAWNLRCTYHRDASQGWAARLAPALCAALSREPDVIVTNSTAGRSTHEAIGYAPRRWEWIPNGFDLERFRPDPDARSAVRAELGVPAEAFLVGLVARWHPMKNHEALLDATRLLADRCPNLHALCVGTGIDSTGFGQLVQERGVPERTFRQGARPDIERIMAALDVLVAPSGFYEGFPNVLGEALACEVPCVASGVGDAALVVGPAGRLLGRPTAEELAGALLELEALGPEGRRELGAEGRRRVADRFALPAVVQRYAELYEELARRPVGRPQPSI